MYEEALPSLYDRSRSLGKQCSMISGSLKKILALLALHEFCRTRSGQNAEMTSFDLGILDNFRLSVIYLPNLVNMISTFSATNLRGKVSRFE